MVIFVHSYLNIHMCVSEISTVLMPFYPDYFRQHLLPWSDGRGWAFWV